MAEVHEGCEMNRSPVLLRLLNHFWCGFDILQVPSWSTFQLFPFLVDRGLAIQYFQSISSGDGVVHQTVAEVGHVSLLGHVLHLLLCFSFVPALSVTLQEDRTPRRTHIFLSLVWWLSTLQHSSHVQACVWLKSNS